MNSKHLSFGRLVSKKTIHARKFRVRFAAALIALAAASAANAQITTINSAVIVPRKFNDIPSATLTYSNGYPASISITESNVSSTTGFANRDVWYFSSDGGTTPYQFSGNDYFDASFSVTLTGGTPGFDLEAGFLFSDPSGVWGGDLQSLVTAAGVVVQFGGPSYYPFSPAAGGYPGKGGSVSNYVEGQTYTFGMNYVQDPATGRNAFQYSVNGQYAASAPGNTYFDIGTNSIGHPGDALGGYLQIQRTTNSPGNMGTVVFSNISIVPSLNVNIAENGNQSVLYWAAGATNFVLQTTTNLVAPSWTTVTNGTAVMGVAVTNSAPAAYYRLFYQP